LAQFLQDDGLQKNIIMKIEHVNRFSRMSFVEEELTNRFFLQTGLLVLCG